MSQRYVQKTPYNVPFFFMVCVVVFFVGCQSHPLSRGAYVGPGGSSAPVSAGDVRGQSRQPVPEGTATSVPLFASRSVKEDARNRRIIETATGRPVAARPVSVDDLIAWRQANVPPEAIIVHIRTHGAYKPLSPQEVLTLQQRGVPQDVIRTAQEHPYPKVNAPPAPPKKSSLSGSIADDRGRYVIPPPAAGGMARTENSVPIYPSYGQEVMPGRSPNYVGDVYPGGMMGGGDIMYGGAINGGIIDGGVYMETPQGLILMDGAYGGCCSGCP
ncbi:MAG: hypothetical protein Q4C96_06460 [Planctomycetia bacterium]|nr:hypothetical protein [Planctomycetia bacterium]